MPVAVSVPCPKFQEYKTTAPLIGRLLSVTFNNTLIAALPPGFRLMVVIPL